MNLIDRRALIFITLSLLFTSILTSSIDPSPNPTRESSEQSSPDKISHNQPNGQSSAHHSSPQNSLSLNEEESRSLGRSKRKYDLSDQRKRPEHKSDYEETTNVQEKDEAYCVIGNVCGVGGGLAGDANIPCHLERKPSTLQNDTEGLVSLKNLCPSLFLNTNNPAICCSGDQIREMEQNFAQPRDLGMGKCPSCFQNFRTLHCEMICSPRQSQFVQIINHELVDEKSLLESQSRRKNGGNNEDDDEDDEVKKPEKRDIEQAEHESINKTERYMVTEINYFLDKNYVHELYESCRNVKSVMGGELINVLCGAPPCSPLKWLKFMGTSYLKRGFSPVQINYFPVDSQFYSSLDKVRTINKLDKSFFTSNLSNLTFVRPMSIKPFKCFERISNELGACICSDCEQTCDILKQSALEDSGQSTRFSGQNFTIVLGWLLFVMVFMGVFVYFLLGAIRERRTYSHDFTKECVADTCQSKETPTYANSLNSVYKMSDDDDEKFVMTLSLKIECFVQRLFERWGLLVATNPLKVLFISLLISLGLAMGVVFYQVTTDPVDLWVSSDSQARMDMEFFNENFWKFYRIEQLILAPKNVSNFTGTYSDENDDVLTKQFSTLFRREVLKEAFELQRSIEQITSKNPKTGRLVRLEDICYQPLPGKCAIQSLFTYFANSFENLEDENYLERMVVCPGNPTYFRGDDMSCMPRNGIPLIYPEVALGGFPEKNFLQAKALIITFPVNNYKEANLNSDSIAWENAFLDFVQDYIKQKNGSSHFDISYKAEKSIEDELDRQSKSDIGTVVVSYLIMFVYILLALSENDRGALLLNTKFTIGLAGVLVVILSVICSLGVFFYFEVPCTLIIVEVIPFLVLAVGIDNLFILVQTYYRDQRLPGEETTHQIARVCGEIFPSMLLSSTSMCACFLIGSYTPMPAVQKFALYACVALLINFLLQSSLFLAIFTLDVYRVESNRYDLFCCIKSSKKRSPTDQLKSSELAYTNSAVIKKPTPISSNKKLPLESSLNNKEINGLHAFFSEIFAPFMMKNHVRMFVIILFASWLCSSLLVIGEIHIGLEQELSMTDDSYMTKYFRMYKDYFEVGPPVYFMIKNNGLNLSSVSKQNDICSLHSCEPDSLLQVLNYWANKQKMESYLSSQPSYFLDNYINYLQNPYCCLKFENGTQCFETTNSECSSCIPNLDGKRPNAEQFRKYLKFFFNHVPSEACVVGGRAQFLSSVKYDHQNNIQTSYIVTYNTPLKTSEDFYEALRQSRVIANRMTDMLRRSNNDTSVEVRPYSFPHVFYEQYLTMWQDTIFSLSLSIGTILIVNFLFFGFDLYSALISAFTITMMIINLMGLMYWWNISLNAISLVNLVVGVGISVEFVSHLLMQYKLSAQPTKLLRAQECLAKMGASVLSGITLTDCGILVLVFAKSKIFQVFYFRMYLGMILFGTLHALFFLPVFLSIAGPPLDRNRVLLNRMKEEERNQKAIDNQVYSV